jgi:hypothetical protein
MSATAELNAKILDFAQVTGEFGAMAKKIAEDGLAEAKEARPLLEKAADALVDATLVGEDERDEVIKLASTHSGALKLVGNLVRHIGTTKKASSQGEAQQRLGHGVPDNGREKKASVPSTESPFVGRRAGLGEKRASDVALMKGLGINPEDIGKG